jgi:hypothetical protein
VRKILGHIGIDARPSRLTTACVPPLAGDCDVEVADGVGVDPDWCPSAQIAPGYQADQRIN